jgi:uroporphyrinogen decarboxylase
MLNQAWENFMTAAQGGEPESVPVALNVDCGFIASAFGMNALDFYMYPDRWLDAYVTLMARFPDVVFLPGFWVEFGMAVEPSAFGTPVMWRHDQAPAMRHLNLSQDDWGRLPQPDPYSDGLMALVLRRYWNLEHNAELPEPHRVHFVAARGPFTIATHVLGGNQFLAALDDEPNSTRAALDVLEIFAETTIRFLPLRSCDASSRRVTGWSASFAVTRPADPCCLNCPNWASRCFTSATGWTSARSGPCSAPRSP